MILYSESFIQFLTNSRCKIARTLYRAHISRLPAYRLMLTTESVDYLTFRADGTISYLPAGKKPKFNDNGQWAMEGRQSAAPAKAIRKLFTKKGLKLFKASDFECFCNSYKSSFCGGLHFELLSSDKIPDIYEMGKVSGEASLEGSCMNGYSHYMDIYRFCDNLKILILKDRNGLLAGRALVWQLDDVTLLDRIYVAKDFMYDCFISYANEHGWWYKKSYKSYEDKDSFINAEGKDIQKNFTVYTCTDFKHFPYIDTFNYGDNGSLNNYSRGRYRYTNTDGTRGQDLSWDQLCHCRIAERHAVEIQCGTHQGQITHVDNTVTVNDQIWWVHDEALCVVDGDYCLKSDTVWSEYDNERYLKTTCIWSDQHQSYILIADSVTKSGKVYHRDDMSQFLHTENAAI